MAEADSLAKAVAPSNGLASPEFVVALSTRMPHCQGKGAAEAGMGGPTRRLAVCGAALLLAATNLGGAPAKRWVGAWAASQMIPDAQNALPVADLGDATLRQVVRVTAGGPELRIRLSNTFGTEPLAVGALHLARAAEPGSARIAPGGRAVTFGGRADVIIPAGAEYVSDPAPFPVRQLERIAVTLHFPKPPGPQTCHPGSRTTSFLAPGRQTAALDLPAAKPFVRWCQLSGVDVPAGARQGAVVAFGDSITDGYGVGVDRDERWPDVLAQRLQANPATRRFSVLNHGIGGNRLRLDGVGPNALARFERDVLAQTGVTHVIILEGVNDLGTFTREAPQPPDAHAQLVREMIGVYAQMAARARARGIKVIGGTITPYGGSAYYHPDAANEADRQAVNRWIRTSGAFDAVIDFDAAVRDPQRPDRMRPDLDSGDGLHPSIAGYRAMAEAVPLSVFR
jgi:lysophospholipase L1-like esterase